MTAFDAELERLAGINGIPLYKLHEGVFLMRAKCWQAFGKTVSDKDVLDAVRIGPAADAARKEGGT